MKALCLKIRWYGDANVAANLSEIGRQWSSNRQSESGPSSKILLVMVEGMDIKPEYNTHVKRYFGSMKKYTVFRDFCPAIEAMWYRIYFGIE